MTHTIRNKQKLLNRVRRIRGQLDAVERALDDGTDCGEVLRQISGCRGAMNGLLAVVLEDHIETHLVEAPDAAHSDGTDARQVLIDVVHSYFR